MESAKTLSKLIAAIYIAMILLSTYLVQRSFILDAVSATQEGFNLPPPQATVQVGLAKLDFYQPTLSIAWPLVLGMLALAFYYCLYRRSEIEIVYSANSDPFYPFGSAWYKVFGGRFFLMAMAFLPFTAILIHLIALVGALAFFKDSISYTMITLYVLLGILLTHGIGMMYTIFLPIAVYRNLRR